MRKPLAILLLGTLLVSGVFLVVAGSLRYGGLQGLLRRVHVEVAEHRPHPKFVPTPLAVVQRAQAAGPVLGEMNSVTPVPTRVQTALHADPSPTPTTSYRPAAPFVKLTDIDHLWQTWNNCGPATLAMNLSYFGSSLDQSDIAAVLKPDPDDKNVSPQELAGFARSQGYRSLVRVNGDAERLRLFLSNGIPVLIETWLIPEPDDGMGHYRLITGYDDATQEWFAYDALVGDNPVNPDGPYEGIRLPYVEMDELWKVFNRTYVLVYTDEQVPVVHDILGEDLDDTHMWERAAEQARTAVEAQANDPFAWFNLGTNLTALGRYDEAAATFDHARHVGLPWRMLWYQFGTFEAYYQLGRYEEMLALADATISTAGAIEELYYWKGRALLAQGDEAGARAAFQRAVDLNPNYSEAKAALSTIGAQ